MQANALRSQVYMVLTSSRIGGLVEKSPGGRAGDQEPSAGGQQGWSGCLLPNSLLDDTPHLDNQQEGCWAEGFDFHPSCPL